MNLYELAVNRDEIMASQSIYCLCCNKKQFSPFDKLYTEAYNKCVDCSTPEELEANSTNIFAIIEA